MEFRGIARPDRGPTLESKEDGGGNQGVEICEAADAVLSAIFVQV